MFLDLVVQSDQNILEDSKLGNELDRLKGSPDANARPLVRRQGCDVLTAELNASRTGGNEP